MMRNWFCFLGWLVALAHMGTDYKSAFVLLPFFLMVGTGIFIYIRKTRFLKQKFSFFRLGETDLPETFFYIIYAVFQDSIERFYPSFVSFSIHFAFAAAFLSMIKFGETEQERIYREIMIRERELREMFMRTPIMRPITRTHNWKEEGF